MPGARAPASRRYGGPFRAFAHRPAAQAAGRWDWAGWNGVAVADLPFRRHKVTGDVKGGEMVYEKPALRQGERVKSKKTVGTTLLAAPAEQGEAGQAAEQGGGGWFGHFMHQQGVELASDAGAVCFENLDREILGRGIRNERPGDEHAIAPRRVGDPVGIDALVDAVELNSASVLATTTVVNQSLDTVGVARSQAREGHGSDAISPSAGCRRLFGGGRGVEATIVIAKINGACCKGDAVESNVVCAPRIIGEKQSAIRLEDAGVQILATTTIDRIGLVRPTDRGGVGCAHGGQSGCDCEGVF